MIEKQLEDVLADHDYLPPILQKVIDVAIFCEYNVKHDLWYQEATIDKIYDYFVELLLNNEVEYFWTDCGFDTSERNVLLKLLSTPIILASAYYGKEYLYRMENPPIKKNILSDFKKADYLLLREDYLYIEKENFKDTIKNTAIIQKSDSGYSNCKDAENNNVNEQEKKNEIFNNKLKDSYEFISGEGNNIVDINNQVYKNTRNQIHKIDESFKNFFAPENIAECSQDGKVKTVQMNFFPEITQYLSNCMPQTSEQRMLADYIQTKDGKDKNKKEDVYLHYDTYLAEIFQFLIKGEQWLPGSHYTKNGYWTINALANWNKEKSILLEYLKLSKDSTKREEKHHFNDDYILLTQYGIEDLTHIDRLGYAMSSYCHVYDSMRTEIGIEEKNDALVALLATFIVYAPSIPIGNYLWTKNSASTSGSKSISIETVNSKIKRALSMNSVIFPTLVHAFTYILYMDKDRTIDSELIKKRLSKPLSETVSYSTYGGNYVEEILQNNIKESPKSKKGSTKKYRLKKDSKERLPLEKIMNIMMSQRTGILYTRNIVEYNRNTFIELYEKKVPILKQYYDERFFQIDSIKIFDKIIKGLVEKRYDDNYAITNSAVKLILQNYENNKTTIGGEMITKNIEALNGGSISNTNQQS